jgi:hypothetical protein
LVEEFDRTLAPVVRRRNGDSRLNFVDTLAEMDDMGHSSMPVAHYIDQRWGQVTHFEEHRKWSDACTTAYSGAFVCIEDHWSADIDVGQARCCRFP